jgi:hypothetical protein
VPPSICPDILNLMWSHYYIQRRMSKSSDVTYMDILHEQKQIEHGMARYLCEIIRVLEPG